MWSCHKRELLLSITFKRMKKKWNGCFWLNVTKGKFREIISGIHFWEIQSAQNK